MAIQFARVERVKRSKGKNAVCKSSYNARLTLKDEQTAVIYTFERLQDNVYHDILLPKQADVKFKNAQEFANEVERAEKRKDSQLYKEYVLALPDDPNISIEIKKELVEDFIKSCRFIEDGLGVQVDLHQPHDGEKNWHAHLLVTTRRFKEDGSGLELKKAVDLEPQVRGGKIFYVQSQNETNLGELWKEIQNELFERYGLENRVDEVAKVPGVHLGPVRMRGLMNEAIEFHEERRVVTPNIEDANDLLNVITEKKAVFAFEDLEKQLKNILDPEERATILESALASKRIRSLYHMDGRSANLFTTKEVRQEEELGIRLFDRLHNTRAQFRFNVKEVVAERVNGGVLSAHQGEALLHMLGGGHSFPRALRVLQGRAGVGKSHILGQLRDVLDGEQNIIGLAPTHKAIAELTANGYENLDTLKGFLFKCKYKRDFKVARGSLFVVDEAGMVGTETWVELVKVILARDSELVLVGDDLQLSSVERGGLFKIVVDRYNAGTVDVIIRQKHEWGREVSQAFANGDVAQGISILQANGKLHFAASKMESMSQLLAAWSKSEEQLANRLIVTIANKDVDALNQGARAILKLQGKIIGEEFAINNRVTKANFGCGDRIVFTETHKKLGVKNGEFATITAISQEQLMVTFDAGRELNVAPTALNFKHGYAATVFKSQGASIKAVYVLHDGFATKNNAYVEMSRHVDDLHVYCNHEATRSEQELIKQLSLNLDRGSSLNYLLAAEERESGTSLFGSIKSAVKSGLQVVADRFHQNEKYYVFESQEFNTNSIKAVINDSQQELQQVVGLEREFVYRSVATATGSSGAEPSSSLHLELKVAGAEEKKIEADKATGGLRWNDEVASIRHELRLQAERVARDLLGEPNVRLSNANTLRFGEHGKLAIEIRGEKAGIWHDFSQGQGGDLLALIAREKEVDFKGALNFAKAYKQTDLSYDALQEQGLRAVAKQVLLQDKEQKLNKLYESSKKIDQSTHLARDYLENKRGISQENISDDLRFVDSLWNSSVRQNMPAIVAFARDPASKIQAAGVVYLDQEKGDQLPGSNAKRAFGKVSGSYIEVQQAQLGITILAEGLETALSLKEAQVPGKILATMGIHNFKHYMPNKDEVVVIAADHDLLNKASEKALNLASSELTAKGAKVLIVQPEQPGDFNDVLKEQGKTAIYDLLRPQIKTYLSGDWLELWEQGDRKVLSREELLNDPDGVLLKAQYKSVVEQRQQEYTKFVESNQETINRLLKLDSNYDLKNLKSKICNISTEQRDLLLQQEVSVREQQAKEQTERVSTPYGLTKQEFSVTVSKNYEYLKSAYEPNNRSLLREGFGAYDFTGKLYDTGNGYLAAIGLDQTVQPLIDYETPLGKEIQQAVAAQLATAAKIEQAAKAEKEAERRQASLALAKERASTPYNLTKEEFKVQVQANIKYLNDGYRGKLDFLKEGFGVEDFKGNKHITEGGYLSALGRDQKLQPLIDYQDDLGKKIKEHVAAQQYIERMRENDRGRGR